jgi:hypothetical protein
MIILAEDSVMTALVNMSWPGAIVMIAIAAAVAWVIVTAFKSM